MLQMSTNVDVWSRGVGVLNTSGAFIIIVIKWLHVGVWMNRLSLKNNRFKFKTSS